MEYQLLINEEPHEIWRCTTCKQSYLMKENDVHTCYVNMNHRIHKMGAKTMNMYYINRIVVCINCCFMGRIETYRNLICPCCATKPMYPLKELMEL